MECEDCWYYDYDEEYDAYYCMQYFDEDEIAHMHMSKSATCPYFRDGNEYTVARKQ